MQTQSTGGGKQLNQAYKPGPTPAADTLEAESARPRPQRPVGRPGFFSWARFRCGETIPDLTINGRPAPYPVMNERAVRATAGLMLIATSVAFSQAFFQGNFLPLKIITPILFIDFTIRVLTGLTPLSPFGVLGTFLVRHQKPEWAGATQKRFAWSIGIGVALLMTVITNMNITGALPLTFCVICMSLMWLETALGVCVGCQIYQWLARRRMLETTEYPPACAGGVCDQAIQNTGLNRSEG
jgi:hypothetical protein